MRENWSGCCWHCGQNFKGFDYSRDNHCPECGKAVCACRNCRFFKQGAPNHCLEPVADLVSDEERANFCDYFSPQCHFKQSENAAEDLLQAAEELFK